jgi:hypothetical protein
LPMVRYTIPRLYGLFFFLLTSLSWIIIKI